MTISVLDLALAPAWRPGEGETLTGAVAHREMRTTDYGAYPVLYIEKDDATLVAVHAFHSTLKAGLVERQPQKGEFISITYAGLKLSNSRKDKGGNPVEYHHYVVTDPDATADDEVIIWDDMSL